jgi:hypothetical protein
MLLIAIFFSEAAQPCPPMDRPLKLCAVLADSKSYHRMSYHHALVAAAVGLILLLVLLASRH